MLPAREYLAHRLAACDNAAVTQNSSRRLLHDDSGSNPGHPHACRFGGAAASTKPRYHARVLLTPLPFPDRSGSVPDFQPVPKYAPWVRMPVVTETQINSRPSADSAADAVPEVIRIRGARMHNLQNLDLDIPRDRLVVITGPSGSGKSSLAFDTLYAEGQRQYIESLSVYARQFLHQLERPDVDLIEGLQPTISIDQRPGSPIRAARWPRSPRSTTTCGCCSPGWAKPCCYQCGEPIRQQTAEQIDEALLALPEGTQADDPGAAGPRPERANRKTCWPRSARPGFVRVRVDGQVFDVDEPAGTRRPPESITSRPWSTASSSAGASPRGWPSRCGWRSSTATGLWSPAIRTRNPRSRPAARRLAGPACSARCTPARTARSASRNWSRGRSASTAPTARVRGAKGLGGVEQFDPELVVPDAELSLAGGAIAPWKGVKPDPSRSTSRGWPPSWKPAVRALRHAAGATCRRRYSHGLLHGDGKGFPGS